MKSVTIRCNLRYTYITHCDSTTGNCCTCRGNRAHSGSELPRHAVGTREAKKETGTRKHIPQSADVLSTRNAHPKTALRCCKRERNGIFATEFFSREKGNSRIQRKTRNAQGKEIPSERFRENEARLNPRH
jgi:hypothetical protein